MNFDCFLGYEPVWSSECLNSCRSFSLFMRKFSSKQGPVGLPKFFFGFGMFVQKVKIAKTKQKVKLAHHELYLIKKGFSESFCKRFNIKKTFVINKLFILDLENIMSKYVHIIHVFFMVTLFYFNFKSATFLLLRKLNILSLVFVSWQ